MAIAKPKIETLITLNQLGRRYGEGDASVEALKAVSLTIQRGQMVALMGPSGSGKSTLMNVLGLFDRASSGSYDFAGEDMTRLTARQQSGFRGHRIGFVFQGIHLLPRLTILDNVELPMAYARFPKPERGQRSQQALELLGVEHLGKRYPSQISGGQAQRAAIARAIAPGPDLLLADEPTGALDRKSGLLVLQAFQDLHARIGVTVVIVTHDAFVAQHAERVIELEDGEIINDRMVEDRILITSPSAEGDRP